MKRLLKVAVESGEGRSHPQSTKVREASWVLPTVRSGARVENHFGIFCIFVSQETITRNYSFFGFSCSSSEAEISACHSNAFDRVWTISWMQCPLLTHMHVTYALSPSSCWFVDWSAAAVLTACYNCRFWSQFYVGFWNILHNCTGRRRTHTSHDWQPPLHQRYLEHRLDAARKWDPRVHVWEKTNVITREWRDYSLQQLPRVRIQNKAISAASVYP